MGLTRIRAEQISNIDFKQSVRAVSLSNITLAGGAPATVDSVTLEANDRLLVAGQTNAAENGIYIVSVLGTGSNGTWVRSSDTDVTGEMLPGMIVVVTEGTLFQDTQWELSTNGSIVIGTTELSFKQITSYAFGNVYANSTAIISTQAGDTITLTAGNNVSIVGNVASKTVNFSLTDNLTANTISVAGNISGNNISSNVSYSLNGLQIQAPVANTFSFLLSNGTSHADIRARNFDSQLADVAERYRADAEYPIGTVLVFGGNQEVTQSTLSHDSAVAGTISEAPAYTMNNGLISQYVAVLALLGRVPCRVVGPVNKGDLLTSSDIPGVATKVDNTKYKPGCVIGKALESYANSTEGIIEIVIGKH